MGEVWRVVPSELWCMASSDGRIMVAPYEGAMPNGRGVRQYGGQPHFGVWNKSDGRFITVYKNKTYKVHRLVCEAFHGPAPDNARYCLHIDENAANNSPDNLKWGTQKENLNAPAFLEYCKARTGDDNPWVKGRIAADKAAAE
jgi:hypothetical protein